MIPTARVAYGQVSSFNQQLDRQLALFEKLGIDEVFSDKNSRLNMGRLGFKQVIEFIRKEDGLYVCGMDWIKRGLEDLLSIAKSL